ncbi:hypothetical protein ACFY19_01570 [Streptosporangium saharense]|uniref:hypothetical protein n=1 Tax=Streptosporangium saharense TaxID=1706840 RepID=UPI0036AB881E
MPFESGRVAVSVGPDLVALTDGEHIWWPVPQPGRRGKPRLAVYRTPTLAAARLAAQCATPEEALCATPR